MSYGFLKELVNINTVEYELEYRNGSNESNELIKVLTKLMGDWINIEVWGVN